MGDEPAFPTPDMYHPNGQIQYGSSGLTKREYFAVLAMQGLVTGQGGPNSIAYMAVEFADALIRELDT